MQNHKNVLIHEEVLARKEIKETPTKRENGRLIFD